MQAHLQRQRGLTMLKHRLTRLNIATVAACVGLTCGSAPAASLAPEVDHGLKTGMLTMPVNESAVRATAVPRDAAPIAGDAQALALLNSIYLEPLGLPDAAWNSQLASSAQNHADYWADGGLFGHEETPGRPGFTGQWPWDRCAAVGAPSCGEVAYEDLDLVDAMSGWMDTPYHGGALIASQEIGCGQSAVGSDCDLAGYTAADTSDQNAAANTPDSPVRIWPFDGARNVAQAFTGGETPDPLASYTGDKSDVGPTLFLYIDSPSAQINLTDARGAAIPLIAPGAADAVSTLTVTPQNGDYWFTALVGKILVGNARYTLSVQTADGQHRVVHFTAAGTPSGLGVVAQSDPPLVETASPAAVTLTVTRVPGGRLLARKTMRPGRSWRVPFAGHVQVCADQPTDGQYVADSACDTGTWTLNPHVSMRLSGGRVLIHAAKPLPGHLATLYLTVDGCGPDWCEWHTLYTHHYRLRMRLRALTNVTPPHWGTHVLVYGELKIAGFSIGQNPYAAVDLIQQLN
jgi:hypothetical protein